MNTIIPNFFPKNSQNNSSATNSKIKSQNKSTVKRTMDKSEQMVLSLLRAGINDEMPDAKLFQNATQKDWNKLLEISNGLSVTAILSDGISKLPKGTVPIDTAMKMINVREQVEKDHAKKVEILGELSEKFGAKGVDTIHMKGAGFSMNYPHPNHRFGNDIDIFTRIKGNTTTTLSDAYNIADDAMKAEGLEIGAYDNPFAKHSEFNYKGVEVDNHKYFIAKKEFPYAQKLDEYLHKNINPTEQLLPNGKKILVPSKEFNSVFLSHHAYQHHVIHELNLHHFVDWVVHVKNYGLQIPEEAKGTKFEKFTFALTNLANRYFGTDVKVPQNVEYEDKLMNEIIYPTFKKPQTDKMGNIELLIHKTKSCLKNAQRIHELGGYSTFAIFGKAVLNKIKHPTTILVR